MPFLAPIVGAVAGAIGAVGTAIGAVGSFIGGLGIVGQALVGIGLNVAGSLLQRAFAKKPKEAPGGVQFEREYGQTVSRKVACGLVGIAGHDCYINTYGSSNKYAQWLFTLSDYSSDGFSRLAINGEWVTLGSAEDPDKGWPVTSGDFANLIWLKFYDGRQTAADPYLVDNANPADRWTEEHIGVGITAVVISMTFDREKNNALPDCFFEFRGARLYDWRKDSSVGGSGAHRWDDPSTHEFSENPILMDYHYRRGFSVNDDLFCGMDMPAGDLPLDKFTAAANICDETDADGERRYRCSIMLDAGPDTTHGDNIESLMLSCGGMVVDGVAGSWPVVGSDQPIVATLTDDDLITTAPVEFRAKRSMAELVNSVAGNFPNPDELWSMVGYDPQISEAAIAVDRRTRDLAIDFPQVRHPRQAAQLASIYLKENRYEASATITARPRFQVLEAGDWIRWDSARYGDRVCMIAESTLASLSSDGPRNARLSLQERDGSIYDGVTPPAIVLPSPPGEPAYLAEVQDFTAVPVLISGADGRLTAGIRVGWSTITDETVRYVLIRYYPTDQPDAILYKTVEVPVSVAVISAGVVGETAYTVEPKLLTDPERVTAWANGTTLTTLSSKLVENDILDAAITELKLADEAVSTAKLQVAAVTEEILSPGSVTNQKIAAAAVDAAKILDGAVGELKLAAQAVSAAKLQVSAVTQNILADGAVVAGKIADAAVTAAKIASGAITATKFASGLTPIEIGTTLPTTGNFEGRQFWRTTDGKLYTYKSGAWAALDVTPGAGSITSTMIADGAISTPKLAANAITAAKINAGAVTADALAANAVTAGKVQAGAIGTSQLAAGAVTTSILAAGAVTADQIAAGAVTTSKLIVTGDGNSVNPDPTIEDGSLWEHPSSTFSTGTLNLYGGNGAYAGTKHLRALGEISAYWDNYKWPIDTGKTYLIQVAVRQITGNSAFFGSWRFYDANGVIATDPGTGWPSTNGGNHYAPALGAGSVPSSWTRYSFTLGPNGDLSFPNNTVQQMSFAALMNYGGASTDDMRLGLVMVTEMTRGELIVDGAVTADAVAAGAITAAKLDALSVTSDKIAANAVTAAKIQAGAVTADAIAANSVGANKIAADAIIASKVVVTGAGNIVNFDPHYTDQAYWLSADPSAYFVAAGSYNASQMLRTQGQGSIYWDKRWPIDPSKDYIIDVACESGSDGKLYVAWKFYDYAGNLITTLANMGTGWPGYNGSNGNHYFPSNMSGTGTGSYVYQSFVDTVGPNGNMKFPPNAAYCSLGWLPNYTATNVQHSTLAHAYMKERTPGDLIVDGTLTAAKIASAAITAVKIASGAITTAKIAAGAVTADKITVSSLAAISATLGDVDIEFANIQNVNIESGMIAANAVTSRDDDSGSTTSAPSSYTAIASITLSSDSGNAILLYYSMSMTVQGASLSQATGDMRVIRTSDSAVVASISATADINKTASKSDSALLMHAVPSAGTYTYQLQIKGSGSSGAHAEGSGSLIAQCNRK